MDQNMHEQFMKSVELKSLQQLAASKVAISVCESKDVQRMTGRFCKSVEKDSKAYTDVQWKRLCNKIRMKLDQVGVPKIIIRIILENLWPVSFEICRWILFHREDLGIESSPNFFWTPQLNIDYEKTAIFIIENETIELKTRFKLACFYCLEQEARSLWEIMSLPKRRQFFVRGNLKNSNLNPIILYWTYCIQEAPIEYWKSKALSHTELFKYAVEKGHLNATKFFHGKLKSQVRKRVILSRLTTYLCELYKPTCIVKGSHFAIAYFLLSEVCPDLVIINNCGMLTLFLRHFLEWPFQKHFLTVFNRVKQIIREKTFGELMAAIFEKDLAGFKDYDYKKLFAELWNQAPWGYKTYVNTDSRVGTVMFLKFVEKHFGFVLNDGFFSLKSKFREIVFKREVSEDDYYESEDVEFFKFLVRESLTTKPSIESFVYRHFTSFSIEEFGFSFFNEPLEELMYLIDGILAIV